MVIKMFFLILSISIFTVLSAVPVYLKITEHTFLNSLPEEVLITYLDVFNYFIIFSSDSVSQRRSSRSGNVTD